MTKDKLTSLRQLLAAAITEGEYAATCRRNGVRDPMVEEGDFHVTARERFEAHLSIEAEGLLAAAEVGLDAEKARAAGRAEAIEEAARLVEYLGSREFGWTEVARNAAELIASRLRRLKDTEDSEDVSGA